jgi:hypothetical protein
VKWYHLTAHGVRAQESRTDPRKANTSNVQGCQLSPFGVRPLGAQNPLAIHVIFRDGPSAQFLGLRSPEGIVSSAHAGEIANGEHTLENTRRLGLRPGRKAVRHGGAVDALQTAPINSLAVLANYLAASRLTHFSAANWVVP